jgi:hypothetical protein
VPPAYIVTSPPFGAPPRFGLPPVPPVSPMSELLAHATAVAAAAPKMYK